MQYMGTMRLIAIGARLIVLDWSPHDAGDPVLKIGLACLAVTGIFVLATFLDTSSREHSPERSKTQPWTTMFEILVRRKAKQRKRIVLNPHYDSPIVKRCRSDFKFWE
jgi:hypothetical protein